MIKRNVFSRENSQVIRGLAILAIMYHNLLHSNIFGFSEVNEMFFLYERVDAFLQAINSGRNICADVVSFFGWLGVPVFVFLTGYGLAKKYPPKQMGNISNFVLNGKAFLRHSYLKLFLLMLPAILLYAIAHLVYHDYVEAGKKLLSLSLLSNFDYPHLHYSPGVYWYFSLTFQYYVLFYFLHNWFTIKRLFLWSIVSLVLLTILVSTNQSWLLSVYRHCFPGWFPLFALGIWQAKQGDAFAEIGWIKCSLIVICTAVLIFVMNLNMISWIVVPIVALMFFITLSRLVLKIDWLRKTFAWIGVYSAFIFVCHPLARTVVNRLNGFVPLLGIVIIYFLITMLLAFFYATLYKKLLKLFRV